VDQRPKQKPPRERTFDRGGPPDDGGEDPTQPRSPNAVTDPESRAALGGTPLPEAAVERANERATAHADALVDVFGQFIDEVPGASPPKKKKK
jgi:hypothetical protein